MYVFNYDGLIFTQSLILPSKPLPWTQEAVVELLLSVGLTLGRLDIGCKLQLAHRQQKYKPLAKLKCEKLSNCRPWQD